MDIQEFKRDVLGIRYDDPSLCDDSRILNLYESYENEISKVRGLLTQNKISESQNISFVTKDQFKKEKLSCVLENPVEIDMILAYYNTLKKIRPELLPAEISDKIKIDGDKLTRRFNKFLVNYYIGLLFKDNKDLSKTVRQLVNSELDLFAKRRGIFDYIIFKKRDGILLNLPKNFIIDNLKDDSRFAIEQFKIGLIDVDQPQRQLFLSEDDSVKIKGIGEVPFGIASIIYKDLLKKIYYHNHNVNLYKELNKLMLQFISLKDPLFFVVRRSENSYCTTISSGIEIELKNYDSFISSKYQFDVEKYYNHYLESWIKVLLRT